MIRTFFRRRPRPTADVVERAGQLFDSGCNCSESVVRALTGREDDELMAICRAHGAGIGGARCLCGALNGGVMALALKGRGRQSKALVEAFRTQHKTTCCKGLSASFRWNSAEHRANCRRLTQSVAALVNELSPVK